MFDAAVAHVRGAARSAGLNVIVAGWSDGSRERLSHVLAEHGLKSLEFVSSYHQAKTRARRRAAARRHRARTGVRGAGLRHHRRAGHSRRPAGPPVEAQAPRPGRAGRSERAHRRRSRRPYRPRRRALRRPARRSRRRARRTTASRSTMPAATGCSCRSRTSSFCRATARRRANSTGSAARAGSRARRG